MILTLFSFVGALAMGFAARQFWDRHRGTSARATERGLAIALHRVRETGGDPEHIKALRHWVVSHVCAILSSCARTETDPVRLAVIRLYMDFIRHRGDMLAIEASLTAEITRRRIVDAVRDEVHHLREEDGNEFARQHLARLREARAAASIEQTQPLPVWDLALPERETYADEEDADQQDDVNEEYSDDLS